jgi:hypothetical protein
MAAVIERVDRLEQALQDFVTSTDVDRFVDEISAFRTFFPEYDALPLVGILVSRSVEASALAYAEKQGFLVLAIGDQLMDVQNSPDFQPKRWPSA